MKSWEWTYLLQTHYPAVKKESPFLWVPKDCDKLSWRSHRNQAEQSFHSGASNHIDKENMTLSIQSKETPCKLVCINLKGHVFLGWKPKVTSTQERKWESEQTTHFHGKEPHEQGHLMVTRPFFPSLMNMYRIVPQHQKSNVSCKDTKHWASSHPTACQCLTRVRMPPCPPDHSNSPSLSPALNLSLGLC